ncbi:MAG: helix-turn-helix transcriptional regulator, partial [Bacteroidota bacterium]
VDGLSYKMIADKLHISLDTVRDHIKRIYRTLEVNSKAEVIKKALKGDI